MSLGRKFAEVASQLSQRPRNTNNEAQFAKEASMNRACSNVVGDILPVVVRALRLVFGRVVQPVLAQKISALCQPLLKLHAKNPNIVF